MGKIFYEFRRHLTRLGKIIVLFAKPDYRQALLIGVAASIEHTSLISTLPLKIVVDVGANVGQFSLLIRHLNPRCRILAFEPLATPAEIFASLFSGTPEVVLHRLAVAPVRGSRDMHVSRRADSSSLLPITAEQVNQFPGTNEGGKQNVQVAPLTDFLSAEDLGHQSLLKIDVQGFELDVLRSAEPLLPHFEWIYLEVSFARLYEGQALAKDILAYLKEQDFVLHGIGNVAKGSRGDIVQADFLFTKSPQRSL